MTNLHSGCNYIVMNQEGREDIVETQVLKEETRKGHEVNMAVNGRKGT